MKKKPIVIAASTLVALAAAEIGFAQPLASLTYDSSEATFHVDGSQQRKSEGSTVAAEIPGFQRFKNN